MRSQIVRRAAAGAAGVALALSVAAALPVGSANAAGTTATSATAARATISITASPTKVKAWQQFVLKGKATGTKAGTKVVVQRLEKGKWVTFPASTTVTRSGSYAVRVKSGRTGTWKFRVATSKAASKAVTITVTK